MATKTQDPVIGDGSLHVGDRVVYPNQGICRITGVEIKQIAGQNWEVVTLSREEDGATVMVPKAKVMGIGLRKVADVAAIDRVFDELAKSKPNEASIKILIGTVYTAKRDQDPKACDKAITAMRRECGFG